jgi:hypothetical protein
MRRTLLLLPLLIAGCRKPTIPVSLPNPVSLLSRVTGSSANGACMFCSEMAYISPELMDQPVRCGACYCSHPKGEYMMTNFRLLEFPASGVSLSDPASTNKTEGAILAPLGKKRPPAPDPNENRVHYCPETRRYYR